MKTMKPKTVFLCLLLMGCVPTTGYADTLQEAIDESLIVPLATLDALATYDYFLSIKVEAALDNYEAAEEEMEDAFDEFLDVAIPMGEEVEVDEVDELNTASDKFEATKNKRNAARDRYEAAKANADAAYTTPIATAKAKARQGKYRARHCRAALKPVDDHLEIVEIVECVQTMEAIADMCSAITKQFGLNEKLQVGIDAELDILKGYVTQCVTQNITGYSALVHYIVTQEGKDRYAGVIEKCRQEETNTLGVLGYEFIWPCFKGYLDMIGEPLEPPPTQISPEPTEDSESLPKVKA